MTRAVAVRVGMPWAASDLDRVLDAGATYAGIADGRRWLLCASGPGAVALADLLDGLGLGPASLHDRHELPAGLWRTGAPAGLVGMAVHAPPRRGM